MRLSWLLFMDVGQAGDSKFQQSAIHWVVPNASHLFVGIRSLWLMFRAPVSLFYHRKEAGVRKAKIGSMLVESGSSQLSFSMFHPFSALPQRFRFPSSSTEPTSLAPSLVPLPLHFASLHFTCRLRFIGGRGGGEKGA